MTGFKSGASDDDPLDDQDDGAIESEALEQTRSEVETERASESSKSTESATLPWLYQRNSITDGRAKTVQLHLQQSTLDGEYDALRDISIDESVQKADLREAAYLVGMRHLDEVADVLEDWGYDFE